MSNPFSSTFSAEENPWQFSIRLIASLSLMSLATLAAIALSIITNKIIAVQTGPEGIALLGLYRSLGAWASQALTLGYTLIFIQRLAAAQSRGSIGEVFGAALLLSSFQTVAVILLVTFAGPLAASWIFTGEQSMLQTNSIRLVLAMTLANLFLQTGVSFLRGNAQMEALATVQLVTAAAALMLVSPLLSLGNPGLALTVGAGSAVGAGLASYLVWKHYRPSPSEISFDRSWALLRNSALDSILVTGQGVLVPGALLFLQSSLGSNRGLEALGWYLSALLIIETVVTTLLSSIRTYLLPILGRARSDAAMNQIFSSFLRLSLYAASAAGVLIILVSGPLLSALFSTRFSAAAGILAVLALSLPGQVFCWTYNTFLLHKNQIKKNVVLDMAYYLLFVSFSLVFLRLGFSEISIAWAYSICYFFWGGVFAVVTARSYGNLFFGSDILRLALTCQFLLLTCWAATRNPQ